MVQTNAFVPVVSDFLSEVSLGDPRIHGSLAVFPLLSKRDPVRDYLVLEEAIAQKLVTVTERKGSATVPELELENRSDQDVLLLDGEMLVGGRQDRILAISLLAGAKSTLTVPVACCEAGRWRTMRRGDLFESADWHGHSRMRAEMSKQVSLHLACSGRAATDQSALWVEQARSQQAHDVDSPTAGMRDVYDSLKESLEKQLDTFKPEANQVGALVMSAGKVVGLDAFDQAATYGKLHARLARGYGLDALELEGRKPVEPKREAAEEFLRLVAGARDQVFPTVGLGEQHRVENGGVTGSALAVESKVIHLSAFASDEVDPRARDEEPESHPIIRQRSRRPRAF